MLKTKNYSEIVCKEQSYVLNLHDIHSAPYPVRKYHLNLYLLCGIIIHLTNLFIYLFFNQFRTDHYFLEGGYEKFSFANFFFLLCSSANFFFSFMQLCKLFFFFYAALQTFFFLLCSSANFFLNNTFLQTIFFPIFFNHVLTQGIGKREIYKGDRNPPITALKRYLLTPLNSSFSFFFLRRTSTMIGGSEKRNRCLNFKCPVLVLLKSAIF